MTISVNILKTVLNLNRVHVEKVEIQSTPVKKYGETYEELQVHANLRPIKRVQSRCPICHKLCPGYDSISNECCTWRTCNINGIPVYLHYHRRRIQCPEHGVLSEFIPWEDGTSRFTESFNNEVAWMALQMSKSAVSTLMGINWRTVGNCIKAAHDRLEPDVTERLRNLRRICVDETSYQKGHSYITVVYDMDRNRVVWVHENHGQTVFEQFCQQLPEAERSKIEIVAGDGAKWIDTCTKEYFPKASRCVDFFHVVEWATEALDDVRSNTALKARQEYAKQKEAYRKEEEELAKRCADARAELEAMSEGECDSARRQELEAFLEEQKSQSTEEASEKRPGRPSKEQFSPEHKEALDNLYKHAKEIKGAKYALGHRPENCTETQMDKLRLIENSYPDLYRAYQLKEALRVILHSRDYNFAAEELDSWIAECMESSLKPMQDLADKITRHRDNILNSILYQVNSAKSEATNTTIKVLIKMARGFRNLDNMKALIYLKCSDLVIPLNNRPQPSADKLAEMRRKASERRKESQERKARSGAGA